MNTRAVVMMCALVLLATVGCSSGGSAKQASSTSASSSSSSSPGSPTSRPAPTTTASTTSTTATLPADEGSCATGSSPANFDPVQGKYATYLTGITASPASLQFDVIQFLTGDDAVAAYHKDVPDDPEGPPNDYYIVNASPKTFDAAVAADVRVRLVRLGETSSAELKPGTFEELPQYLDNPSFRDQTSNSLSFSPYWLTIKDSKVVEICEQFVP